MAAGGRGLGVRESGEDGGVLQSDGRTCWKSTPAAGSLSKSFALSRFVRDPYLQPGSGKEKAQRLGGCVSWGGNHRPIGCAGGTTVGRATQHCRVSAVRADCNGIHRVKQQCHDRLAGCIDLDPARGEYTEDDCKCGRHEPPREHEHEALHSDIAWQLRTAPREWNQACGCGGQPREECPSHHQRDSPNTEDHEKDPQWLQYLNA